MLASLRTGLPSLAFWLLASFAAGAVGALASMSDASFYATLTRPPWAPPPWLFAPVWSVLYFLMGVSAWLVWQRHRLSDSALPYVLFFTQLAANALWTWIFFTWQDGRWAFIEILLLWGLIVATFFTFKTIRPLAAWLLVPYFGWVTFAALLTFTIWRLNPDVL